MKKFSIFLIGIFLLISCTNKLEKVMNELEENSSVTLRGQKSNALLFANDVDTILEGKANGTYTTIFTRVELEDKTAFEKENKEYIVKHTIEESVKYLEDPYFEYQFESFQRNSSLVVKNIKSDTPSPIKDDIKSYKISNLFSLYVDKTLIERDTYDTPRRKEIMDNNELEWQKKAYEDDQVRIKKLKAQQ